MYEKLQKNTKDKKRVGRGGKRGKTSGHGHKGQKARAGKSIRPAFRDALQRLPKKRGHNKNRSRSVVPRRRVLCVNLSKLEKNFKDKKTTITPNLLCRLGIINKKGKKIEAVKILGVGELKSKIVVSGFTVSETAEKKIVKTGGKVFKK